MANNLGNVMKKESEIQSLMLFVPEIKQLIKEKELPELKRILNEIHPVDLAEGFKSFNFDEQLIIFSLLHFNRAIAMFEDLEQKDQAFLIENLETSPIEKLLEDMPADEKTKLVKKMPERLKKKLLSLLRKEDLTAVQQTLNYREDTAGSIMNTYFIPLQPGMTTRQAIEKIHLLSKFRKFSVLHTFYVVNAEGGLLGGISLRKLVAAPPDIKISEVMVSVNFIKTKVDTLQEEVAKMFAKYDLVIAPVVNGEDKLVGVITVDDVIDIVQAINTKQFYEIGKMSSKGEIRYSEMTVLDLIKKRAGWLILLLVFDFLTGSVLKFYEATLATMVALTFFIPMLLDTGGNAGAQASITLIRSFATGDVNFKNIWKAIRLELIASVFMAFIVGFIAFLRALMLGVGFMTGIVVGLSMIIVIMMAISTGMVLPIVSKKVGLDPAVLAGPITTSVVDVLGLIAYFKVAQFILPQLKNLH